MGFKRKNKIILIAFTDEELAGLEIRARSASIGQLFDVVELLDIAEFSTRDMPKVRTLIKLFAGCPANCQDAHPELADVAVVRDGDQVHHVSKIESWNLEEEDGTPIPQDFAGLMGQDFDFVLAVVMGWLDGVVGTSGPLGQSSNAGTPSEAPPMPMETLPADLLS